MKRGLSVTLVIPAKTAEPIEMPFGLSTQVGPRNHVLDCAPDLPMGRGSFEKRKGRPIVKYRDTLRSSVLKQLNRSGCRLACELRLAPEINVRWGTDPHGKGVILRGKGVARCKV